MFLDQKTTEIAKGEVLKGLEKLDNLDFSNIKMSSLIEKLVEWAATTGFKFIVGALIISIGFKIINKLVGRFMHFIFIILKKLVHIYTSILYYFL